MFGKDAMIKLGLTKLKEFIKEKGNSVEFTENEINDFIASKGEPFTILCIDNPEKGKIIKLIYSGE